MGFLAIALACAAMIGAALYLQYYRYLNPCPLCMFQRYFVLQTGVLALLAAMFGSKKGEYKWQSLLVALSAVLGGAIAVRHTILQYWPPENLPSCGAGLFHMLESTPFGDVVISVLKGSGECAVIDWTLLGLSLPFWSAVGFAGLAMFSLALGFLRKR